MAYRKLEHSFIPAAWWHDQQIGEWSARPLLPKKIRENVARHGDLASRPGSHSRVVFARQTTVCRAEDVSLRETKLEI